MATEAVVFNSRIPQALAQVHQIALQATQECFELDIKPAAVEGSPVRTGHNRRSIDTTVEETPRGPSARLFTQSGYGGYLEVGTRFMAAEPYLWPAFQENIQNLPRLAQAKIQVIEGVGTIR